MNCAETFFAIGRFSQRVYAGDPHLQDPSNVSDVKQWFHRNNLSPVGSEGGMVCVSPLLPEPSLDPRYVLRRALRLRGGLLRPTWLFRLQRGSYRKAAEGTTCQPARARDTHNECPTLVVTQGSVPSRDALRKPPADGAQAPRCPGNPSCSCTPNRIFGLRPVRDFAAGDWVSRRRRSEQVCNSGGSIRRRITTA